MAFAASLALSAGIMLALPVPASAQWPDLTASIDHYSQVRVPTGTPSVAAGATQDGTRAWDFSLQNGSQQAVSNPTIAVNSGYDASHFDGVSSFPVTYTQPSLAPGNAMTHHLFSDIPVTFTLGYDSTATISPAVIPAGGGQQTVTITLTPVDARYTQNNFFTVWINTDEPIVSVASATDPDNLTQGELLSESAPGTGDYNVYRWGLTGAQLNKTYTFRAVLDVVNPSGQPFDYAAEVFLVGKEEPSASMTGPLSSITINDATLDGGVPGSGAATFSAAGAGHDWYVADNKEYSVFYDGMYQAPGFDFTGFLPPVDNPPTVNTVKAGAGIPVKFSLSGDQGLNVLAEGSPTSQQVACLNQAPVDAIEATVSAGGGGLSYDPATDQYTYVWKTQKSWAQTCRQLDVGLSDGSHHLAAFQFR